MYQLSEAATQFKFYIKVRPLGQIQSADLQGYNNSSITARASKVFDID